MLPFFRSNDHSTDYDLITSFYNRYVPLMYSEAKKYLECEEDAEDVVCEAFVKIIEKSSLFNKLEKNQQLYYAITTVRNLSYTLAKRNGYFSFCSLDCIEHDFPDSSDLPQEILEKKQFHQEIINVWSELPLDDRMLLEQKYLLKWSDKELAKELGILPQSVRMRLTRAKRNIYEEMKKKGFSISDWL